MSSVQNILENVDTSGKDPLFQIVIIIFCECWIPFYQCLLYLWVNNCCPLTSKLFSFFCQICYVQLWMWWCQLLLNILMHLRVILGWVMLKAVASEVHCPLSLLCSSFSCNWRSGVVDQVKGLMATQPSIGALFCVQSQTHHIISSYHKNTIHRVLSGGSIYVTTDCSKSSFIHGMCLWLKKFECWKGKTIPD